VPGKRSVYYNLEREQQQEQEQQQQQSSQQRLRRSYDTSLLGPFNATQLFSVQRPSSCHLQYTYSATPTPVVVHVPIVSDQLGLNYSANENCAWTIFATAQQFITISFQSFQLGSPAGTCDTSSPDYVVVRDSSPTGVIRFMYLYLKKKVKAKYAFFYAVVAHRQL